MAIVCGIFKETFDCPRSLLGGSLRAMIDVLLRLVLIQENLEMILLMVQKSGDHQLRER